MIVNGAATAFAIDVKGDGSTEVFGVRGESELKAVVRPFRKRLLGAGQATRVGASNAYEAIPPGCGQFPTSADFERLSASDSNRRKLAWEAAGRTTDRDPDFLVHYRFEPDSSWDRTLKNSVPAGLPQTDGAIVGSEWVEGRWPGKGALEFKRVSDRVRLLVPGTFDSITLVASVRVDVENGVRSLMMSEGLEAGDLHWQISKEGEVVLGVNTGPRWVNYISPVLFTAERIGQWYHLAVVYDHARQRVTHYVNGQPVCSNRLELKVRRGSATPSSATGLQASAPSIPIRNFSGRMDEFLAFGRALSDDEINRIFAMGQPGI